MKTGDLVLVEFPFTDTSSAKVRPALVVSGDRFNQGEDVVIVPLSSAPEANDPFAYLIRDRTSYFRQTGLRRTSSVKWTKPVTIAKSMARRRLGTLAERPLSDVLTQLQRLFGAP